MKNPNIAWLLLLFFAAPAFAQTDKQDETEIIVTGLAKSFKLTGKQLAEALAAFERHRPSLAPASNLYFQVKPQAGGDISGIRLTLRSAERDIPLSLDAKSRFVLPPLQGTDWTLFADRNRGSIAISPMVMSPGTSDRDRRLGDIRLQCEVLWGMMKSEQSVVVRAMFSTVGGCHSNSIGFYVTAEQPITAAQASSGARTMPLKLWGDRRYRAPLGKKALPDDTRLVLTP